MSAKLLFFPKNYTEEQRQRVITQLAEQRLESLFSSGRSIYDEGRFAINEEAYESYVNMIDTLNSLSESGKVECEFDDPRVAYDVHEVKVKLLLKEDEELPIEAKEIISIVEPLAKANGDSTVNIEPDNTWVFYVELYYPIEGWDNYFKGFPLPR